jgi:sensory rhodopsin
MSTENLVLQTGAIIFATASLYFLLSGKKIPNFSTEFFTSYITLTSYAVMNTGIATTTTPQGQTIYWSRWLFYIIACTFLMYDTAKVLNTTDNFPKMAVLTWITMINGFLASYIINDSRWIFYALGSVSYIGLIIFVLRGKENPDFTSLKSFILVGWTLFPVIFLLSPTGTGFLDTVFSEVGYLILDIVTKIFFGHMTSKLK